MSSEYPNTGTEAPLTEAAVAEGKDTFSTASLVMTDVENHAEYKAKSMGISAGSGGGGGGFGKDSDDAKSVTYAGISGYAGNMVARTGDAESGIPKIFDVDKVQREIDAQVTITRAFGQVVPRAVADFADRQTQRYRNAELARDTFDRELANETDPTRRAQLEQARDQASEILIANQGNYEKWREGGACRVALHAALGGLAGGYTGALGAGAAASAAPAFNEQQDRLERSLANAGANDKTASGIARFITGVTAAGVGGALTAGDFASTGQALNVDSNNRQLHEEELERIEKLAAGDEEKRKRLTIAACALVKCYAEYPEGSLAYQQLKVISEGGASDAFAKERALLTQQKGLFEYTTTGVFSDQRADSARRFNNTYQVGTRTLGAVQAVAGVVETIGAVALGVTTCETGVGCAAAFAVGAYGVDSYFAGANTVATGVPQATVLNQGLQKLGLDETSATYVELATGAAGAISLGRFALASTKVGVGAGFSADELAEIGAKARAEREVDLNFYKDSFVPENAPVKESGKALVPDVVPGIDRDVEIRELFDTTKTRSGVQIGSRSLVPVPTNGNARIFSGATDAEVLEYFKELSGVTELPTPRVIPGKGNLYTVKTPEGNFNLRDFSTSAGSTGPAWTVDIPKAKTGTTYNPELKFLR